MLNSRNYFYNCSGIPSLTFSFHSLSLNFLLYLLSSPYLSSLFSIFSLSPPLFYLYCPISLSRFPLYPSLLLIPTPPLSDTPSLPRLSYLPSLSPITPFNPSPYPYPNSVSPSFQWPRTLGSTAATLSRSL